MGAKWQGFSVQLESKGVFAACIWLAANTFAAFACVLTGSYQVNARTRLLDTVIYTMSKALSFWRALRLRARTKQHNNQQDNFPVHSVTIQNLKIKKRIRLPKH